MHFSEEPCSRDEKRQPRFCGLPPVLTPLEFFVPLMLRSELRLWLGTTVIVGGRHGDGMVLEAARRWWMAESGNLCGFDALGKIRGLRSDTADGGAGGVVAAGKETGDEASEA